MESSLTYYEGLMLELKNPVCALISTPFLNNCIVSTQITYVTSRLFILLVKKAINNWYDVIIIAILLPSVLSRLITADSRIVRVIK